MTAFSFRRVAPADVRPTGWLAPDDETLARAAAILRAVREGGLAALRAQAERLGDLGPADPLVCERAELWRAADELPHAARGVLERTAARIAAFAHAQRGQLEDGAAPVPGGRAGWQFAPVERAGCYAPGGRYPLPSSVLMTAVTARVAGVREVVVASPRPALVTRAAAAIAGADLLVCAGGAQAIAALAYGAAPLPACDVVVGPGNRWVTAAKQLIAGSVRIDMLAGPSELVVLADEGADPACTAADLLAQAEHDPDAVPVLVTLDATLLERTEREITRQLAELPTAQTATAALANGFAIVVRDAAEAVRVCDRLAPEHLALHVRTPRAVAERLQHYGALFLGGASAEVFGDYGAGPNHVLPTGGTARSRGGLSVLDFLRVRTWLDLQPGTGEADALVADVIALAELEGLAGHACSAGLRRQR